MEIALVIGAIFAIILMMQYWFWLIVFFVGGLASFFALIASVIHFQILWALGFSLLTFIFYVAFAWVAENN